MEPRVERAAGQVAAIAPAGRRRLEQGAHLVAVATAPPARVEPQDAGHVQPPSTRGGMIPGSPSATGSGPSVTTAVSIVRTPSASTSTANRSMPRGAGPKSSPSALVPSRS